MGLQRAQAGVGGGTAAELIQELQRRASLDPANLHPYKVTIVATRVHGEEFTVVYRQHNSPQLLGTRGNAVTLHALFGPLVTPSRLAAILLQTMSEPNGPGQPGPESWGSDLVPDPSGIRWISV